MTIGLVDIIVLGRMATKQDETTPYERVLDKEIGAMALAQIEIYWHCLPATAAAYTPVLAMVHQLTAPLSVKQLVSRS